MGIDGPAGNDRATYEAYCPHCEVERTVLRTVDWQDDTRVSCSRTIDLDH